MDAMKLLHLLAHDPRATVTDLADILGESEEEVAKTKDSLEAKKIICGYHTVINWDKTNIDHVDAFIGVSAKPERGTGYDKIAERIGKFPEVSSLYLTSGTSEFLLSINARTMREVADFVGEKLAPIDGVAATVTMFVLKKYKVNGVILDMKAEVEDDRQLISA
ncbi:MAG: Lrp/AsnC family transcriptional regulator [Erysipelotrichaceae bacterium]|jgi:DNA-binding Lrp family transcriptional regulator|nr:Lrp/AsnC family transcriptional regulator [Erysipelotrichaceae bacterium]